MKTSISKKIMVQDVEANSMYDDTFTVYPYSLTPLELEAVVVMERLNLYNKLKPCGAVALRHHLKNSRIRLFHGYTPYVVFTMFYIVNKALQEDKDTNPNLHNENILLSYNVPCFENHMPFF